MQRGRRNVTSLFERRMLHFGSKLIIFAIVCVLILGQSDSQEADDSFIFPGPSSRNSHRSIETPVKRSNVDNKTLLSVSLKIAQRINAIGSYEEFLRFIGAPPEENIQVAGRFDSVKERSNAEKPKPANCMPELTPVSLKIDNDPMTFAYPSCTRIMRCGGCCTYDLLSCQPVATQTRNFRVVIAEFDDNLDIVFKRKEIVTLEEHTECKCDCKVKEEHCNQKQIYEKDICKCVCTNTDEEAKCRANNNTKLWDVNHCSCLCREIHECATGFYFDQNTCRCQKIPLRFQSFTTTKGYKFGQTQRPESVPPVIVTLDASDPRRKPKDDPEY